MLTILYWQAPSLPGPYLSSGFKDRDAAAITLEPLARYDPDGNLVPALAAQVPTLENGGVSQDLKSITWKLKEGLKWSDGSDVTAQDAVFTWRYCTDEDTGCTGESSFEISVAADFGLYLWTTLMRRGARYGITPFGTEAMHVLRAEKGFIIAGQDTDGTVTPDDLGLGRMVSRHKDFIGKRSLSRADTCREDRKQLVGLLTEDPKMVLPEGAQIVERVLPRPPMRMIGHVTSSYYSANLGRSIALALLGNGRRRHGERVTLPLPKRRVAATVTAPVFIDPDGERMRA